MSTREFLERTAYAAGLAAASGLPLATVLSEAAEAAQRSSPLRRRATSRSTTSSC